MNDINYVVLGGNLTRDPSHRQIDANTTVCRFTIAVNRGYYNKKEETWVNIPAFVGIETWNSVADACANNLKKGRGVRVVGRLHQSTWNGQDGLRMDKLYVLSEHVEFQPIRKTGEPQQEEKVIAPPPEEKKEEEMAALPEEPPFEEKSIEQVVS